MTCWLLTGICIVEGEVSAKLWRTFEYRFQVTHRALGWDEKAMKMVKAMKI